MTGYSVKIVSDGTFSGTKLYNSDGTQIKGVTAVSWDHADSNSLPTAVVKFTRVAVDLNVSRSDD